MFWVGFSTKTVYFHIQSCNRSPARGSSSLQQLYYFIQLYLMVHIMLSALQHVFLVIKQAGSKTHHMAAPLKEARTKDPVVLWSLCPFYSTAIGMGKDFDANFHLVLAW